MTAREIDDPRPKALVVYESEFGATRVIAEAIARGLRADFVSRSVAVSEQTDDRLQEAALIILGAPTHVHGLSTITSRGEAWTLGQTKPDDLSFEGDESRGMREWLEAAALPQAALYAAFGTRAHGPALFTGSAAAGIARRLRRRGLHLITGPATFMVDGHHHLEPSQQHKAEAWGAELVQLASRSDTTPSYPRTGAERNASTVKADRES